MSTTGVKAIEEPKKTVKRDALKSIEQKIQQSWEHERVFEVNAPTLQEISDDTFLHEKFPKYMGTFPYPYMNGRLHLGHFFTITKVEFATGYERMRGKRALFPLGFHCTGMPIKACADKLLRELEQFGPNFILPEQDEIEEGIKDLDLNRDDEKTSQSIMDPSGASTKVMQKKGKVVAKSTGQKYQFQIMKSSGVPDEEIAKFADANHWIYYFPPLAIKDCKSIGAKIDWRRSFVTTDVNPYYDSFVRWQMRKLKALNKIKFGERYTIYSPIDGQPCMDHDRQSGEGIGPQEYTGIKLKVLEWSIEAENVFGTLPELETKDIYFVAATLRPETMYGQTNCFVGIEINYGLFKINDTDVFICTHRAARNMAFQGYSEERGKVSQLAEVKGSLFIGTKVSAPLSKYKQVYVLPMENVLATKGTGVVTSVPSDSPDDYITLMDLKKKAEYYKIHPSWADYEPIPIIHTPSYGDLAAPRVCQQKKINSQKDRLQLTEAKELVYKEGFYNGTMIIGDYKGQPVQEAKALIKDLLVSTKQGFIYNEPEGLVMSRSGDECVVALCDQWYLDYGEEEWKKLAEKCLSQLNTFCSETRHQFEQTLAWLNQWACARSYGLGSRLPWDPQYLVESLSDSTIYMAYYTVAHLLQGGALDGSIPGPLGIQASEMTDKVWDYIFNDGIYPTSCSISQEKLDVLKREFKYFYPLDLRVSGKDLIPNHLTFFIYNHVAIFPEKYWPTGIRSNGHLQLNREKMSKSTGNFMTGGDAIVKYGADATRVALADAGDAIEDANFEESTANAAILRLFTLKEWCEEQVKNKDTLRTGSTNSFHDKIFENEINKLIQLTDKAYNDSMYREALKYGFYELQSARDWYREATAHEGMHKDLVLRWIEIQALLLSPIAPHWSEYIWKDILSNEGFIVNASFPTPSAPIDEGLLEATEYVRKIVKSVRDLEIASQKKKKKGKGENFDPSKPKSLKLFVATQFPEWQDFTVEVVKQNYDEQNKTYDDVKIREVLAERGILKNKKTMPFVQEFKKRVDKLGTIAFNRALLFNEYDTLNMAKDFIQKSLGYDKVDILRCDEAADDEKIAVEIAVPGEPGVLFKNIAQ
ncbi:4836_t:CDS:10 [Funneliformis geosporum]|uniref:leucine--tRNA ligase n=1 Tax=Funneliformis geosporum TaxID=1117311 RepID=A0A9W4SKZ4_9GLOM|nr:17855_t:CDS:10 [Funneliformis geosporum]CAI2175254.1 4836_t:CDS:10 [Funneliformis geosporum]